MKALQMRIQRRGGGLGVKPSWTRDLLIVRPQRVLTDPLPRKEKNVCPPPQKFLNTPLKSFIQSSILQGSV